MSPQNLLTVLLAFISAVLLLVLIRQKGKKEIPRETESLMHLGKHLEQLNHLVRQVDEMSRVFHSPRLRGGLTTCPWTAILFSTAFREGKKQMRLSVWEVGKWLWMRNFLWNNFRGYGIILTENFLQK